VPDTLAHLPAFLQDLFVDYPQQLNDQARQPGAAAAPFCQRLRVVTPSSFVRTLVFGWLDNPKASVRQLAEYSSCLGPPLSESGLRQHFSPAAVALLREVLDHALQPLLFGRRSPLPLLRRFRGVYLFDSTILSLPACLARDYPGCGNQGLPANAAVKMLLGLELTSGGLVQADFFSARDPDQALTPQCQPLPPGALRYADLGFFSLAYFKEQSALGVYWFSRAHPQLVAQLGGGQTQSLMALLAGRGPRVDLAEVTVGTKVRLRCRLIAWRVPDAVAQRRKRKLEDNYRRRERRRCHKRERGQKLGKGQRRGAGKRRRVAATAEQLQWCEWVVVLTNVPPGMLSAEEAEALLRARWQVELLIKVWKGSGCLEKLRGKKRARVECELLAKVLGQVVAHWAVLASGRVYLEIDAPQAVELVKKYAERLGQALGQGLRAFLAPWQELLGRLKRVGKRRRGRRRPSTEQRLAGLPPFWEYDDAA
jgi:Transposase DDE domain